MKSMQSLKLVMLLLLATALATTAFGGDAGKGNFQISTPVQVNGTTLAAGNYTAKWDGTGPAVQVNIVRNGKTVATVPAKLVESDQKATEDATEIQNNAAGSRELKALHFSGKKYSLQLGSAATEAMKPADPSK